MAARTGIEWTDATWNPIRGCTRISDGCRNCYAETIAARFSAPGQPFHGFADRDRPGSKWTGRVEMIPAALEIPLGWRKPRRIFVNSMADLFHEALPIDDIATVYGHAIAAQRIRGHTFQILTKRAQRMAETLHKPAFWFRANDIAADLVREHSPTGKTDRVPRYHPFEPPPGIWHGVSVENQENANERIPWLHKTPTVLRYLSCEPLLGPVSLRSVAPDPVWPGDAIDALLGRLRMKGDGPLQPGPARIAWVIAGGESGPGARPAHPGWFRQIRDDCAATGVAFHFKQWGAWAPEPDTMLGLKPRIVTEIPATERFPAARMMLVRKHEAGAVLDGREHRDFPHAP